MYKFENNRSLNVTIPITRHGGDSIPSVDNTKRFTFMIQLQLH